MNDAAGRRALGDGDPPPPAGSPEDWAGLFMTLPIGAYRSSLDGRLLRANPALVRMNGYASEAEIVAAVKDSGREWYVDPGRRRHLLDLVAERGSVAGFISEVRRHATGEPFWVSESVTVVRDADGRPHCLQGTVEDITEQMLARRDLEHREAQLRLLGEQLPGMIYRVTLTPGGGQRFEYVSQGVAHVYGVTPEDVMRDGTLLIRMRHPEDAEALDSAMGAAQQAGRAHSAVFRVVRPDGGVRWVHGQSAAVSHGPDGAVRAGIVLDITAHQETERLRRERDDAEARRLATASLMSRISHELRTPLNAVLGFSQLLEQEPGLAAMHQAWVRHILDSGRHLLALVEDVLDLSRADGGELMLRPADIDIGEAVLANWAMLAAQAASARVVLCPLPPAMPPVHADPLRLRQVLGNLMSNAIKYNRPGGEVRVSAERRGDEVSIAVTDTGVGLTAAQRERLFQPFERLGAERGGVAGTGLGLTLSRQLVQAMGGRIEVQSAPGEGSCFTVWLPAAAPAG